MTRALLLLVLLVPGAWAQGRQNVLEYLEAALKQDRGFATQDRERIFAAIKTRFANYGLQVVPRDRQDGVKVVMRMIIEGHFDETPPERIAEVSFAAYQAISRGAPADVVEGIALYGYRKRISGERISVWANGYNQLLQNKVPAEIAADLVRNAMEQDLDDGTFNMLKWALVQGLKEGFDVKDYAIYLFGHMIQGKQRPGALSAAAHAYFKKLAKTKGKPELPPYEGVFSRKPVEGIVYEAKPKPETEPSPAQPPRPAAPAERPSVQAPEPPAAETPRTQTDLSPQPSPAPAAPEPSPRAQASPPAPPASKPPPPPPERLPRELGLTMTGLWPGLDRSSRSYLGTPYVFGGETHRGIDCSALTQNSYVENRVGIPRNSRQQWRTGDKIDFGDLREGDLIFFNTQGVGVSHVGMIMDPQAGPKFMHASSSRGVVIDNLSKNYYKTRYLGARRIVP